MNKKKRSQLRLTKIEGLGEKQHVWTDRKRQQKEIRRKGQKK